jgi:hypothetical protein
MKICSRRLYATLDVMCLSCSHDPPHSVTLFPPWRRNACWVPEERKKRAGSWWLWL